MGRRKIEIQPIQHDRNRSVTFLKRKNGLFKKAYELGVLCSADVAVIVFGHNHKLYEYCSGDINALLQRQREYSGDRDIKGPSDYSADKGDGGDDDSDSGGETTAPRGKTAQSKPKGKGATANDSQSLAPEGRFAVPPPLPETDRPASRSIKREELPPLITSTGPSGGPATSSMRNTSIASSATSMRWHNDNGFSAHSGTGGPMTDSQSYDTRGGDWARPGDVDRRTSWNGGMAPSGISGPSSPLGPFYQPPPAVSRPMNLLTPANSHPTPLNEILAANPHLAQQLGSAASPNPGFGNNPSIHELYNNPIFHPLTPQGPPSSSSQSVDMDWQMSRNLQPPSQSFNSAPRNAQQYTPQHTNSLPPELSWLEMLSQGDRGSSEPWPSGEGQGHPKRPLSSTTPISPPETGGTPHHENNELETDNALGIVESDLGGAKRARIQ